MPYTCSQLQQTLYCKAASTAMCPTRGLACAMHYEKLLIHRCGSKGDIVTQYFLCWLLHHPIALSSDIEPTNPQRNSGTAPSQMPVAVIRHLLPKLQVTSIVT